MTVRKRKHPQEPEQDDVKASVEAGVDQELERLRTDAQESRDRYLRTLADFDNYRKRQRDDLARQIGLAREELILKLLPIMDNFQRVLESAEAGHNYDTLVEGASLTLRQMMEMLQSEGVEPIDAVGRQFNPELHEAMMTVDTDDYPDHTVIDEFERGYTVNGKVLRPSRVRVATSSMPSDHV